MINNINETKSKEEVLDFFLVYLKSNIELFQRKSESEDSFDKPSWAEYQAYNLGAIKALKKILAIIPDREKK